MTISRRNLENYNGMNNSYQHFILTRFNIKLWSKDKNGQSTQTEEWLKQRFDLFETYCLPSIQKQTQKNFKWIVLFDADTPAFYKEKIAKYQKECKHLEPRFVSAENGRYFVRIFKENIVQEVKEGDILITTYLDNDDALRNDYVEEIQRLAATTYNKTFIVFKYGLQYFVQLNIATRIPYRNNHFISFVEKCTSSSAIKTVVGYGSHINVGSYKGTDVLRIEDKQKPMWIEVIHDTNMDNDVKMTFDTCLITDQNMLAQEYGISVMLSKHSRRVYLTHFLVRALSEVVRHVRLRFTGRKWN